MLQYIGRKIEIGFIAGSTDILKSFIVWDLVFLIPLIILSYYVFVTPCKRV